MESDENCERFVSRVMVESFDKVLFAVSNFLLYTIHFFKSQLLNCNAVRKWSIETQIGVYNMCTLFIDLATTRLQHPNLNKYIMTTLAKVNFINKLRILKININILNIISNRFLIKIVNFT